MIRIHVPINSFTNDTLQNIRAHLKSLSYMSTWLRSLKFIWELRTNFFIIKREHVNGFYSTTIMYNVSHELLLEKNCMRGTYVCV